VTTLTPRPPASVRHLVAYLAAALAMAVRVGERDARWHQVAAAVGAFPTEAARNELLIAGAEEQFAYGLRLLLAGIRAEAAQAADPPRAR
jgi:hypothetical protein